ncbi:MAG: PocR ligand-binding domain-containing protein [Oscillospiraceae bacterium]|nr:PocR ligand-binding domain-containing protein [Oscillospiraceae bacterium]
MKDFKLTDLISTQTLQEIQDRFSHFTGIAALTTDSDGNPVTKGSGFTDFCMNMTRKSELGSRLCAECDKNGAVETYKSGKTAVYTCHAGLTDFAAPIMLGDKMIGSFIGGQVRSASINEEHIKRHAADLGLDPDSYFEAAKNAYFVDKETIEKAADFLAAIAGILSETAYQNYLALSAGMKSERAARSQAAFITDICTGLNGKLEDFISSAAQALELENRDMLENAVKTLMRDGADILSMSHNAVNYIKMSNGNAELAESEYCPKSFFTQLIEGLKASAGAKGISLRLKTAEDLPMYMLGDVGRLSQIMNKILVNDISATENGTITVDVSSKKESYSSTLVIKISDDMLNMTDEELENVRISLSGGRLVDNSENSFLDFSVAGLIVNRMSGSIAIQNCKGQGCEYILTIPQLEVRGGEYNGI